MMKSYLFIVSFLLLVQITSAQLEWVSNGNGYSVSTDFDLRFIKIKNNGFAITAGDVFVIDNLGQQVYQFNRRYGYEEGDPVELALLPGGELLIGEEWYYPWHLGVDYYHFTSDWEDMLYTAGYWIHHRNAKCFSDASCLFYNGYDFIRLPTENSQIIDSEESFCDLIITSHDTIITTTETGIYIYNKDLDFVYSVPTPFFKKIIALDTSAYIASNAEELYLLDSRFEVIDQFTYNGEDIVDIYAEEGVLAILTNAPRVYTYTYSLAPISTFAPQESSQFNFVSIVEDKIILAGIEGFGVLPKRTDAAFIKSYTFQGNTANYGQDASVTSIDYNASLTQAIHPLTGSDLLHRLFISDLKVVISNNGTAPLQTVTLWTAFPTYRLHGGFEFAVFFPQYKKKTFHSLDLLPGESKELSWPDIKAWYNEAPDANYHLCVWTGQPNGRLDNDNSNDRACKITITNTRDISLESTIHCFPNPVAEVLNIESASTITSPLSITIFDLFGREIYQISSLVNHIQINTSLWPKGTYIIKAEKEEAMIDLQKIVKL